MFTVGILMNIVFIVSAIVCYIQSVNAHSVLGTVVFFFVGSLFVALTMIITVILIAEFMFERMEKDEK